MISPDFPAFKRLTRKGNLIAVMENVPADLETPVSSFLKLSEKTPHAFLLESAEQEERIGRYSFLGLEPESIYSSHEGKIFVTQQGRKHALKNKEGLLDILEKKLAQYKLANPEFLPAFCGGFVGYLSYENVQDFESVRLLSRKGPQIPEGIFFLTKELLIFDHFRKTLSLVILAEVRSQREARKLYEKAKRKIAERIRLLRRPLRLPAPAKNNRLKIRPHASPAEFEKKVKKIKEYIRAGDCIQVVLSQRFSFPGVRDDFQIYRALRSINPSPYMFYFRAGNLRLIGSSPELLVKKMGRDVEVRPIAGTRPRGKTLLEDHALEENLRRSPKEMAEHLMLVDLGRNDLGRVSLFDSIRVENFARVERYSHVMHLVSDVIGKLRPGKNAFDLLRATFPAGTVTGAPKIRAMQIINELETERRGPYAGCLGYFSFNQNMDMCITIRTLVIQGSKIYVQAGAGIVKDSSPKREYQEVENKAKALLKAVERRGDF